MLKLGDAQCLTLLALAAVFSKMQGTQAQSCTLLALAAPSLPFISTCAPQKHQGPMHGHAPACAGGGRAISAPAAAGTPAAAAVVSAMVRAAVPPLRACQPGCRASLPPTHCTATQPAAAPMPTCVQLTFCCLIDICKQAAGSRLGCNAGGAVACARQPGSAALFTSSYQSCVMQQGTPQS